MVQQDSAGAGAGASHAQRLRAGAVALDWKGPQAEAFRRRIEDLADRCMTAAESLARSADQLEAAARPR